ncbi:MAG: [acyl-carrier-protein] S-malonyltransferase [Gammaproteobacteria bacterium]|nr:[acyl-carrier-protein] S-malonyltransferase [Gammaproteobacteria bacterium]
MTVAFVFPGQGSQSVGMLSDLYASFDGIKKTFEEVSESLGYDLWDLIQFNEEKLNQTQYTQPAILTASVAMWRVWREKGEPLPHTLAGHSLGEYTALVCANSINLVDAARLVAKRGEFMQEAVKPGAGAMAAILGLPDAEVIAACQESAQGQIVSAVNFNCPGQVVIAGTAEAVNRACEAAKAKGAKRAQVLPVSVPSHCDLMRGAADRLAEFLDSVDIRVPEIPVVHNVDVTSHHSIGAIRQALKQQLFMPVRWVETIQYLSSQGITRFIECGPGKVLTGLNKRIVEAECEVLSLMSSV